MRPFGASMEPGPTSGDFSSIPMRESFLSCRWLRNQVTSHVSAATQEMSAVKTSGVALGSQRPHPHTSSSVHPPWALKGGGPRPGSQHPPSLSAPEQPGFSLLRFLTEGGWGDLRSQ